MKLIRNIIIVFLFLIIVAFCLYIATNYKKSGLENKTNLVINFKNVTATMKGEVIRENGNIYISLEDIKNYYDKYIYMEKKYNYIIATGNGHIVCFNIETGKASYDEKSINAKIIKRNEMYYVPINILKEVYNINAEYKEKTNIVTIDSIESMPKQSKVSMKVHVKSKPFALSKTLEKIDVDSVVYVKPANDEKSNATATSNSKDVMARVNQFISEQESRIAKDWVYVKTSNGTLGYIPKSSIGEIPNLKQESKEKQSKVSLVWDYFENTIAIPKNNASTNYKGINVVSPAFLFVDSEGNIKENIGDSGQNYITWAKSKNYEIWPMVKCDNLLTDNMRQVLRDYKKRSLLINQIVQKCETYKFDGVNIDMENISKDDKDYFSRLIIELKPKLESRGMKLSVDVTAPDGSDNWSLCYDRKAISDAADYIIFMAYDQTSRKSANIGSNASYTWVENNIKKFINNYDVQPDKLIIAIPFYSRLWKVNANGVSEGGYDINMNKQEKNLSKATKKEWKDDAKQNYIEYTEKGYTYKMWVEDAQSISKKLDLINKYSLAGAAYWEKGCETEDVWKVIEEKLF